MIVRVTCEGSTCAFVATCPIIVVLAVSETAVGSEPDTTISTRATCATTLGAFTGRGGDGGGDTAGGSRGMGGGGRLVHTNGLICHGSDQYELPVVTMPVRPAQQL